MVKLPKIYLNDSGLLHALLEIRREGDLIVHPGAGASWESFVLLQIIRALPAGLQPFFFRTSDGTERALVLVKGIIPIACIEIKLMMSESSESQLNLAPHPSPAHSHPEFPRFSNMSQPVLLKKK